MQGEVRVVACMAQPCPSRLHYQAQPAAKRASELAPMELWPSPTELAPSFSEPEAWLAALTGPDTAAWILRRQQVVAGQGGQGASASGSLHPQNCLLQQAAAASTQQLPTPPCPRTPPRPRRSLHVGISVLLLLLALAGCVVAVRAAAVQHLHQVGALLPRGLHRRHRHAQGPPGAGAAGTKGGVHFHASWLSRPANSKTRHLLALGEPPTAAPPPHPPAAVAVAVAALYLHRNGAAVRVLHLHVLLVAHAGIRRVLQLGPLDACGRGTRHGPGGSGARQALGSRLPPPLPAALLLRGMPAKAARPPQLQRCSPRKSSQRAL